MPNDPTVRYEPADPDGLVVATLTGELDLDRADEVRDSLAATAGQPGCRYLRVDVSGLGFIDSSGLGAIVACLKHIRERGGDLVMEVPANLRR